MSEAPLRPNILEKVFEKYWLEFEERFEAILAEEPTKASHAKRNQGDMLSEILNTMLGLDRRMVRIEENAAQLGSKQSLTSHDRLQTNIKLAANMLGSGQSEEEVLTYVRHQWGYSLGQAKTIIDAAQQILRSTKSDLPVDNDMLQQLRNKFGK